MLIEIEKKYRVNDYKVFKLFTNSPSFVLDEIYGNSKQKDKIRKRTIIKNGKEKIEIERTTHLDKNRKKELKLKEIPNKWRAENSYNKIRYNTKIKGCDVSLDLYVIGAFIEIEGKTLREINQVAKKLKLKKRMEERIDDLFCREMKKKGLKAPLNWGFFK